MKLDFLYHGIYYIVFKMQLGNLHTTISLFRLGPVMTPTVVFALAVYLHKPQQVFGSICHGKRGLWTCCIISIRQKNVYQNRNSCYQAVFPPTMFDTTHMGWLIEKHLILHRGIGIKDMKSETYDILHILIGVICKLIVWDTITWTELCHSITCSAKSLYPAKS